MVCSKSDRRRGTTLILYTLMLPLVLIPLVGLAIDGTMLYIVQAKLSAAADGAAIGAGRLLGTQANTAEIAGEFLNANFPSGYWGSYNLVPNIQVATSFSTHTITVSAQVDVPLLFMRIFGRNASTVAASAVATRRDTRVVLVLDRSNSMSGNISSLKSAAITFTNLFTKGADELGLVVFGGAAFVAYPTTRPYSLTTGTGPNVHFADTPPPGGDNMLTLLNSLQVGTDTGTAEGLWLAYQELKKANAIDADPTRMNAIVLFTDGVPNGFTAWFNDPANNALNGGVSQCTYCPSPDTSAPLPPTQPSTTKDIVGWMATTGSGSGLSFFNPSGSSGIGIYNLLVFDTTHSARYWMSQLSGSYVNDMIAVSGTPVANCRHLTDSDMTGLRQIPPRDYYGNSTTGTAYTNGILYKKYKVAYDSNQPNNGYHVGLASWNVTDNAAAAIRSDTNMNIAIYCIGYTGNGGVDTALLKRIANTLDSTSYNPNQQTGLYVEANDAAGMANAFNTVASEILRLAQ
jgi:hypothetical protein